MDRTVLQGVLINEVIEVLFQLARDFGRSPGAWAVDEPPRPLVRKTIDPLPQGGIRKLERVGDGLETLAFDDGAHGLRPAEDAGLFRLLQEGI
jgi:hypothetical protein